MRWPNGIVERVTEVDAQWAAHPIPVYAATLVAPFNTVPYIVPKCTLLVSSSISVIPVDIASSRK